MLATVLFEITRSAREDQATTVDARARETS